MGGSDQISEAWLVAGCRRKPETKPRLPEECRTLPGRQRTETVSGQDEACPFSPRQLPRNPLLPPSRRVYQAKKCASPNTSPSRKVYRMGQDHHLIGAQGARCAASRPSRGGGLSQAPPSRSQASFFNSHFTRFSSTIPNTTPSHV